MRALGPFGGVGPFGGAGMHHHRRDHKTSILTGTIVLTAMFYIAVVVLYEANSRGITTREEVGSKKLSPSSVLEDSRNIDWESLLDKTAQKSSGAPQDDLAAGGVETTLENFVARTKHPSTAKDDMEAKPTPKFLAAEETPVLTLENYEAKTKGKKAVLIKFCTSWVSCTLLNLF